MLLYLEKQFVTKQSIGTEQTSRTWPSLDISMTCVIVEGTPNRMTWLRT